MTQIDWTDTINQATLRGITAWTDAADNAWVSVNGFARLVGIGGGEKALVAALEPMLAGMRTLGPIAQLKRGARWQ